MARTVTPASSSSDKMLRASDRLADAGIDADPTTGPLAIGAETSGPGTCVDGVYIISASQNCDGTKTVTFSPTGDVLNTAGGVLRMRKHGLNWRKV